jgi:hypothetical protein
MFPVIQHLSEVCSLSCRANFEPVSVPLQNGIRFFRPPLPTHLLAHLAGRFPYLNGGNWAYPVPPILHDGLASAYLPGEILVQASQHLWPVHTHDIYQQFTYVTHTILLSSHPDDASGVELPSRGL